MTKKILILLLIVSFPVFAAQTVKTPLKLNFKKYQCKQKILPIAVEYETVGSKAFIKFTSEGEIRDFKVISVRGLDGLVVSKTNTPPTQNFPSGSQIYLDAMFAQPEGLSYLVVDLEGKVNSTLKNQSMPFPIGEVTQKQTLERQKNIKLLKSNKSEKTEKFNMMKLDSE